MGYRRRIAAADEVPESSSPGGIFSAQDDLSQRSDSIVELSGTFDCFRADDSCLAF
jgi:hypothetical protein